MEDPLHLPSASDEDVALLSVLGLIESLNLFFFANAKSTEEFLGKPCRSRGNTTSSAPQTRAQDSA